MVSFTAVNPADIPTEREGRRGRVSYPLLKSFLEQNIKCAKMNLDGLQKNPAYLRSVLFSYIRSHQLPIKIFQSGGGMYLMRLDLNNDGTAIEGWKPQTEEEVASEGAGGMMRNLPPQPITAAEVAARSHTEKGQTTK